MTLPNPYRGFASLDAILSLIPLMLILLLAAGAISSLVRDAEAASFNQQVFDKTASVADYTVKAGAARHEGGVRYPNWVDSALLTEGYSESMRARSGLSRLFIGYDMPDGSFSVCLYRLVADGEDKAIRKLNFCGG